MCVLRLISVIDVDGTYQDRLAERRLKATILRVSDDSPGGAGGATQMPISRTHAGSPAIPTDVSQDGIRTRFPRHTHNS